MKATHYREYGREDEHSTTIKDISVEQVLHLMSVINRNLNWNAMSPSERETLQTFYNLLSSE